MSKTAKNILDLTKDEKRVFLNSIDHVFMDIDGVVWNLGGIIEGAAEGIDALRQTVKHISFITNNSTRPMNVLVKKFDRLNIKVSEEDIWHPAKSIVTYLKSINFDGLIYIIAMETFKNILREAGFKLIDGPTKILNESFTELESHIFDHEPVRAVIIDVDFNLTAAKILRAQIYLRHPECLLIAGATDNWLPVRKNINIIGPGPFAKILLDASQKPMIVLGKPGPVLGKTLKQHFNIKDARRALMVGDMLEQDVRFGKVCGFQTLVVLSGGCTLHELENEKRADFLPDYYAESLISFVEFVRDLKKSNC